MAITVAEKKKYIAKGEGQVDEGLPGWFNTFADMMTLLFAFFVLLAAISTIDPVKYEEMADSMGKSVGKKIKIDNQAMSLMEIKKAAEKMIEEMAIDPKTGEKPVEVTTGPKGVTIAISNAISFKSGSAATMSGIMPVLEKISPTIKSSNFQVAVEGHTDSQQLPEGHQYLSNWDLSGARAAAVVRLLIQLGVSPTRLQAVGFGEYVPRDKLTTELINMELIKKYNSDETQMKRNRRVEITFLAPRGGPTGITNVEPEKG